MLSVRDDNSWMSTVANVIRQDIAEEDVRFNDICCVHCDLVNLLSFPISDLASQQGYNEVIAPLTEVDNLTRVDLLTILGHS